MDARILLYFKTVAETKNFTNAAKKLHIAQPSLSNAIKSLEKKLDCTLFERNTRRLTLTESGEVLYKHAEKVIDKISMVEKEMEDVKTVGNGTLKIGMIESSKYWMPGIIKQVKEIYPNITIQLNDMGPQEIITSLLNYDIHLGITADLMDHQHIKSISLFKDSFILLTREKELLKKSGLIHFSQLKDIVLIHSLSGYDARRRILNECKKHGFEPKIEYETESLESAHQLVINDLGSAVVPESFIKYKKNENINPVYFKDAKMEREVFAHYIHNRYLPPVIDTFIELLTAFHKQRIE